jgi:hypothetical protein
MRPFAIVVCIVALVISTLAIFAEAKGPAVTHKVYFDIEQGGKPLGRWVPNRRGVLLPWGGFFCGRALVVVFFDWVVLAVFERLYDVYTYPTVISSFLNRFCSSDRFVDAIVY